MTIMIGLAGADNARVTTDKEFNLGTPCMDDAGNTWTYVKHHAATAAAGVVGLNRTTFTTEAGTGFTNGPTAGILDGYGWIRRTTPVL